MQPADRARIAIYADEPALVRSIQCALQAEGYEAGEMSWAAALYGIGEAPDLFLIDRGTEDRDGMQVVTRLLDEGWDATPKIAMSASPEWLRTASESALFDAVLDKPFDVAELLRCVERHAATA